MRFHLEIEPDDEIRRCHCVEFDAVGLQPRLPAIAVIAFEHVLGDRLAPLAYLYSLDLQPIAWPPKAQARG